MADDASRDAARGMPFLDVELPTNLAAGEAEKRRRNVKAMLLGGIGLGPFDVV